MVCKNKKYSPYYITTWFKCKQEIIFGFNTCLKKKKFFIQPNFFFGSEYSNHLLCSHFFFFFFLCAIFVIWFYSFLFFFPTLQFFTFVGLSFLTLGYIQLDLHITHKSKHIFFIFSLSIYSYLMEILFNEFY